MSGDKEQVTLAFTSQEHRDRVVKALIRYGASEDDGGNLIGAEDASLKLLDSLEKWEDQIRIVSELRIKLQHQQAMIQEAKAKSKKRKS